MPTYTIRLRRGLAADWTAVNPVLAEGETGVESDTRFFKVGTGAHAWNALPYVVGPGDLLPDSDALPDGQILLTFGGEWVVVDLPSGLPDPTGVPDGYMIASLDETWVVQAIPASPTELPNPAGLPDGKLLGTLDEAWVPVDAPEGGGGGGGVGALGYIAGVLVVGVGSTRIYNDSGGDLTIGSVRASVNNAPLGSIARFDINKNGTTIFTTQANRPTIAASGFTSGVAVPDVTTWPSGQYLTVDVDDIGSTYAGANATIQIGLV